MHTMKTIALAGLLVLMAEVAAAQTAIEGSPANPAQLVAQWTAADATCRNPAASAIDAIGACEQRDTFSKLLALASYCHDPADRNGPARWTACGNDRARMQRDAALARSTAPFQRMGGVFVLSALLNGSTQTYFI